MTAPGADAPDGAWVLGSRFGQDTPNTEDGVKKLIADQHLGPWNDAHTSLADVLGDVFDNIVGAIADALFPAINSGEGALADIEDGQNEVQLNLGRLSGYCNLTMSHNWTTGGGLFQQYTPWTALPFDTYIGGNVGAHHENGLHQEDGTTRHGITLDKPGTWILGAQVTIGTGNGSGYSELELEVRYYDSRGNHHHYSSSRFSVRRDTDYKSYFVQKPVMIPDNGNTYYALCLIRHRGAYWWPTMGGSLWSSFSAFRLDKKTDRGQPGDDAPDGGRYH